MKKTFNSSKISILLNAAIVMMMKKFSEAKLSMFQITRCWMSFASLVKIPYNLAIFTNFNNNLITICSGLFLIFGIWYNSNITMSITNGKYYCSSSTILFYCHNAGFMLKVCIDIYITICCLYAELHTLLKTQYL